MEKIIKISDNTAGLLLYEGGKNITISPEFVSLEVVPYKPLSTDYSIDYYSSLMQEIEKKYGVSVFTSNFVGDGLIPWEENFIVSFDQENVVSHIAVEVPGEETSNEWLEKITDEEYSKLDN